MKPRDQQDKDVRRQIKRILVPTDFSKAARKAVDLAAAWAGVTGGRIQLLYVEPTPLPAEMTQLPVLLEHERHVRQAKRWLLELREEALPANRRGAAMVRKGSIYNEILKAAVEQRADLIAMGTHGYSGLTHALLGSVTERVVRHASLPVLTVREGPRSSSMPKRVLLPVDFSGPTAEALSWARAVARGFEARITLLHVLEPPSYPVFGYVHVPLQERRWRQAAMAQLEILRKQLEAELVEGIRIRTGRAYQEIVAEAKGQKANLIVIGTHGHTGLSHMLLGSTAERVVRHAPCPVLTIRTG